LQLFLGQMVSMNQLVQFEEMDWMGGKGPPANEPFCGYMGTASRCTQKGSSIFTL
jgi:hypothetical protein